MRPLEKLPVWVVIRLCTDEDKMATYWSNVDSEMELSMDVIDDHLGEAKEIYRWQSHRRCAFHNTYHITIICEVQKSIYLEIIVSTDG